MHRLDCAIDVLIFEIDGEADENVLTHLQDHHRCHCCILLVFAIQDFHQFLISFSVKFLVPVELFIVVCLLFNSAFNKPLVSRSKPAS